MWICPFCGNKNPDDGSFCSGCGSARANAGRDGANVPAQMPSTKGKLPAKKIALLCAAVTLLAAAAAAVLMYFFVHSWRPATCTEPETCSVCGKTQGAALGHRWAAADCTEPKTCLRCGETDGAALGHDWTAATCTEPEICSRCGETGGAAKGHAWEKATYDAPKTCAVCGVTSGKPLGFVGELHGDWGEDSVTLQNQTTHAFELEDPVKDCFRLKMDLELDSYDGDPFGNWSLYACNFSGKWVRIGNFDVDKTGLNRSVTYEFALDTPTSFTAIVPVSDSSKYFNVEYYAYFYDAQVK